MDFRFGNLNNSMFSDLFKKVFGSRGGVGVATPPSAAKTAGNVDATQAVVQKFDPRDPGATVDFLAQKPTNPVDSNGIPDLKYTVTRQVTLADVHPDVLKQLQTSQPDILQHVPPRVLARMKPGDTIQSNGPGRYFIQVGITGPKRDGERERLAQFATTGFKEWLIQSGQI